MCSGNAIQPSLVASKANINTITLLRNPIEMLILLIDLAAATLCR